MKYLSVLVSVIFIFPEVIAQDFNRSRSLSVDVSAFPLRFLSSMEIEYRSGKPFLMVGAIYDRHGGDYFGYKAGWGIYPYKNAKRWKVFHQLYYYKQFVRNTPQYRRPEEIKTHYGMLGHGVEYELTRKLTLGSSIHTGYGNRINSEDAGLHFYASMLFTLRCVIVQD